MSVAAAMVSLTSLLTFLFCSPSLVPWLQLLQQPHLLARSFCWRYCVWLVQQVLEQQQEGCERKRTREDTQEEKELKTMHMNEQTNNPVFKLATI